MNLLRRLLLTITILMVAAPQILAASIRVSVQPYPGRSSINVGDKFYVEISLDNVNANISQINVPGATVAYNSGATEEISASMSGAGASVQRQAKYTFVCRAQQAGSYTLGPFSAGGVKSNVVRYSIGSSGSSSSSQQQSMPAGPQQQSSGSGPKFIGKGDGNLFMRASVSKTNAYEQEALVYTVKLYCSFSRIKFVGATASPKFEGFVVEESKATDNQLHFENYNGRTYATAVIARYIIFPQMTGNLKVTGNTYTVSVDEREFYRDEYFGGMTVSRPMQLNVSPNDLSINVKPLPQPKPADFSGGVGKFSISSSMPSTQLRTGETASIIYTVTGSGNLKYVTLPDLSMSFPKEIEVYSPQTNVQTTVGSGSVSGSVKFDYSLMPDEEGDFRIPDVTLVYFNPETGKYEKAVAKGYNVKVGKGNASSKSHRKNRVVFDSDLMKLGDLSHPDTHYVYRVGYWMVFLVALLIFFGVIFGYRKYLRDNADMSAVLSRKANKIARRRLRKAEQCMRASKTEQFYDEMLAALWGYISDKLKMPTSELTRENVSDVLCKADVDDSTVKSLIKLLDDCEFAKYSPASGASQMQGIYDEGVDVINKMENAFKNAKHNRAPQGME